MALFESILFENFDYADSGSSILEQEAEELGIEPTDDATDDPEYMDEAFTSYCEEMYKLDSAMYIVDVQLESAVFEGASVEAVAENALTDFINRVKEKILELWHKFQDFVTKVTMSFRGFVSTASGFISKHSGSIKKKAEKNKTAKKEDQYTYSGYDYDELVSGNFTTKINEITKASGYKDIVNGLDTMNLTFEDIIQDVAEKVGSKNSVSTASELFTHIQNNARGTEKVDAVPDPKDVENWITFNKKGTEVLKKIGQSKLNCKREFDKIIKALKKDESKAKKDDRGEAASKIHARVRMLSSCSSLMGRVYTTEINLYVEAFRTFASRLKAINNLSDPDKDKKDKEKEKKENASSSFASGFNSSLLSDAYDMI